MRTTIRLDDALLAAAKRRAADSGTTLTNVIEDALRAELWRQQPSRTQRVRLPTYRGDGLQPGVDLDDSAALLEHMEAGGPVDRRR